MHESFPGVIVFWVIGVISEFGYPGIFTLMALESVFIPIPPEIVMPFSGFLVKEGRFSLIGISLAAASGNLAGSWMAYAIGYYGEKSIIRRLVRKFGKYLLITENEFDFALKLFAKHGLWIAAIARVLPGIRSFISLPAGMAKLHFIKFSLITFFGSLIWSFFLGYIGLLLGENWQIISPYFKKFDVVIAVVGILAVVSYVYYKLRKEGE